MYNNELYHYGVLGMKWGVRRARNKYGILTNSGKKQASKIEKKYRELENSPAITEAGKLRKAKLAKQYAEITGTKLKSKKKAQVVTKEKEKDPDDISGWSNDELQKRNTRYQLENTYRTNEKSQGKKEYSMSELSRKRYTDMSNDELQAYNTRKQLENTYVSLQPKKQKSRADRILDVALNKVVAPMAVEVSKKLLTQQVEKMAGIKPSKK